MAADDYFYLALTRKGGAWYAMSYQYHWFCGRWMAHLLACTGLRFAHWPFFFPVFHFLNLGLLYIGFRQLLKKMLPANPAQGVYALVFCLLLYFASYSIAETWFWYIAVCTYLWSIIALLFLFNELLSTGFGALRLFLLIFVCLFTGGAAESYAVLSLLSVLLLAAYILTRFKKGKRQRLILVKSAIALLFLTISFSITMLAQGTSNRELTLPVVTTGAGLLMQFKVLALLLLKLSPARLPYLMLFGFPFFFLASAIPDKPWWRQPFGVFMLRISLLLILVLFILLLPTTFSMYDIAPGRALSFCSLAFCLYSCTFYIWLGKKFHLLQQHKSIQYLYLFVSAAVLIYHVVTQYTLTSVYAKQYNTRMALLNEHNRQQTPAALALAPLPPSGMLYWEEIKTDTSFYVNQQLKMGLKLKFSIYLLEKP